MSQETIVTASLLFVIGILIVYYIVSLYSSLRRKKSEITEKKTSEVGFVVETFHDLVSKLKEKERELEVLRSKAEARASDFEVYNENIFQSVPSGVVSFDQDLRITKINSAAEKILGLSKDDVINNKHDEIFSSPVTGFLEKKKTVERAEISYVTHTGKRIWLGLTISPLKDGANDAIGQIVVFTDLTELKAFQSQKELRDRLSTLGEMSAGIAHELRNPMGVISGYTKILSKKVDDSSLSAVEAISREIAVMDRIIADFLSFAKPAEPVFTEIGINDLIKGCIQAIEDSAVDVSILLDSGMLTTIKGDDVMLRQAIINLLQNAIDSMPEGGEINIRVSERDYIYIYIQDTGHGIPENIRDKIFLPFYTTKERGTGLGLSIVHKIVVSHGGHLQVESSEKGTTFTIRLPKEMMVE
jgi:two-component system sensor histidine kinase PilS (NtrC family)